MSKQNNSDRPPAYPSQAHLDAGPVPQQPPSPYNSYGGFNNPSHKPDQSNLDPRAGPGAFSSPAPGSGGYASPAPQGQYGPPQAYYGPPQGQQMYYGPPQGYYAGGGPGYPQYPPQQGGYYGNRGYYDNGHPGDGACAGIMGALACCCCLDLLLI